MRLTRTRSRPPACAGLLCLVLAACGGGGGSDRPTPFPTESTDTLPAGARIDVASKNLFPMGSGDIWRYTTLDAGGNPTGVTVTRQVTAGPDPAGNVSISDDDGGLSVSTYVISADGVLDVDPTGGLAPATARSIIGAWFAYATPLYPQGAERKHVRSGPWGADLDGDRIGESFRLEFTQVFVGFESVQLSAFVTLDDVAHFHDVFKLTLRPTAAGNTDYSVTATEDAWFAPGLGMVKAQRAAVDSEGFTVVSPYTLLFREGTVAGVHWDVTIPPPRPLDGSFVDIPLAHNALVYDSLRNRYYASVSGSVIGNGNSIATIDPTTGQVAYSAPVGSNPDALAIAADASALYVGLDGSGDVVRLGLPAMTELGRTKLINGSRAESIAVSPADPSVVAVSMAYTGVSPRHAGVALLRDMVMQPNRTQGHTGSNLIAFDSAGAKVYGLNTETTEFGLRRIQVLADGLAEELVVAAGTSFSTGALSFSSGRVIAGHGLYDAPQLTAAGSVASPSDCRPQRSGNLLMCFDVPDFNTGEAQLLLADSNTLVLQASLLYANSEPGSRRSLVEGPAGQVAISYPVSVFGFTPKIRLFTSAQLPTPPSPPAPSWAVTASSTQDGQVLDVGIAHNSVVYDSGRNVYYASIPGSVIGAGNSIATIDPATGQVTHSAPVGSEPNALAIAADGSVLYVGLEGSGEVERLVLPSMAPNGRTRLIADSFFGRTRAESIAVSPADPSVVAVSMAYTGVIPRHAGVALLRDMVMQPNRTQGHTGSNLVTFDSAGTAVYGQNTETTEFGLRHIQVLSDGLLEDLVVSASVGFGTRALSFANSRVITGRALYDAPALGAAGVISGASDCWPTRTGTTLVCFGDQLGGGRVLVADSGTFVIEASLVYAPSEPNSPRRLVQGPADQVAVSYPVNVLGSLATIRLFTSNALP